MGEVCFCFFAVVIVVYRLHVSVLSKNEDLLCL